MLNDAPFDPMNALHWAFDVYRSEFTRVALPIVAMETIVLFATMVIPGILGAVLRIVLIGVPLYVRVWLVDIMQYTVGAALGVCTVAYAVTSLYAYLLDLARGAPVELADAFRPGPSLPKALVLVLVLSAASAVGLSLCLVPGILVLVVSSVAFPTLIDRELDVLTTIRECIEHTRRHVVPMVSFGVLCIAITLIGGALCAIGAVFVAIPLVMLMQVYVYLRLNGEVPEGEH